MEPNGATCHRPVNGMLYADRVLVVPLKRRQNPAPPAPPTPQEIADEDFYNRLFDAVGKLPREGQVTPLGRTRSGGLLNLGTVGPVCFDVGRPCFGSRRATP